MFNLVCQWPTFSKNISMFSGYDSLKSCGISYQTLQCPIQYHSNIHNHHQTKLKSCITGWQLSMHLVEVRSRQEEERQVFVCQPWNVTYIDFKEQVQWDKTVSKRSISCEKGHLQIFYSDDMRKPIKQWTNKVWKTGCYTLCLFCQKC